MSVFKIWLGGFCFGCLTLAGVSHAALAPAAPPLADLDVRKGQFGNAA